MKYRVELSFAAYPLDKLWIDVKLDHNQVIDVTDEYFGNGTIRYSGDARDYTFSLYESSERVTGIDWEEKRFPAGELHMLTERVAKGDVFKFFKNRERSRYEVTKVVHLHNPLRRVSYS